MAKVRWRLHGQATVVDRKPRRTSAGRIRSSCHFARRTDESSPRRSEQGWRRTGPQVQSPQVLEPGGSAWQRFASIAHEPVRSATRFVRRSTAGPVRSPLASSMIPTSTRSSPSRTRSHEIPETGNAAAASATTGWFMFGTVAPTQDAISDEPSKELMSNRDAWVRSTSAAASSPGSTAGTALGGRIVKVTQRRVIQAYRHPDAGPYRQRGHHLVRAACSASRT